MIPLLAAAHAARPVLEDGALVVREGEVEVARVQLVPEAPCPDSYDCAAARFLDDGTIELREEGRINHLLRAVTVWRLEAWPLRVVGRSVQLPQFDASGLSYTLDHATLGGSFRATGTDATGHPLPIVDSRAPFGVPLGACAVTLDASMADAVVFGAPGEVGDARISAVLVSDREVWIEIADDAVVTGSASWLFDDHLEIWSAGPSGGGPGVQWAIGLDGEVVDAAGSPPGRPTATVQRTEGGARLRVQLPWPTRRLTVVYSDSDDGERQERLLATSRLTRGAIDTFSPVVPVALATACEVGPNGSLAPRLLDLEGRDWLEVRSKLR